MKRKIIQSIKGFNDILPDKIDLYYFIEDAIKQLSYQYCLKEIRVPLIEKSDLFNRSIGEETDIVTKEMYEFTDKNKDLICKYETIYFISTKVILARGSYFCYVTSYLNY